MEKTHPSPPALNKSLEHQYLLLLGDKVKHQRRQKELTQAKLSSTLGISRASIANIERGLQRVSIFLLARIAQELEEPIHTFIPQITEAQQMYKNKQEVPLPENTKLLAEALKIHGITSTTTDKIKEVLESYNVPITHKPESGGIQNVSIKRKKS